MPRLPKGQNKSQEDYADFSKKLWDEQDNFYSFWIERWKRSIDFLRSLHWRTTQLLDLKQIPEWKRFPIVNLTLAFYSDYLSQFLQSNVRFSAVPASSDADDVDSAELADHALKYAWDMLEIDEKKIDLAAWLAATGNADMRVFWNSNTGDMIPLAIQQMQPNGQMGLVPIDPETGQPNPAMSKPIMVDAGEIGVEVVPPQMVRHSIKPSHGTMVGYLLTFDDAAARFGEEKAEELSFAKMTGSLATDMLSVFPTSGMPQQEDVALVIEHYLPKSTRFPDGLWWTSSNRKLMTDPSPLPSRHVPIVHFRWIPLPGHPTMGLTPLYDVTFSNKVYDEMMARLQEWLNKVVPKVIRQNGDGNPLGKFTDEPGQEIVVQPGLAPTFLAPPPPPDHFFKMKADIMDDAKNVAGYGIRRPPSLPAGEASKRVREPMHTLNEGEIVSLAIVNSKNSWKKMGYIILDYMGNFYTESRVAGVVGPDRTYQWREFSGEQLKNINAAIHVDELSLYTWNRQSLRDTVVGLLSSPGAQFIFGGPDGQIDQERVEAAMNAAGVDVSSETLDPDVLEARNELSVFRQLQENQQGPKIMPWQNSETHIFEKTKVMKALSFKAWPDYAKQALLQNVSEHEKRLKDSKTESQNEMLKQEQQLREIRAVAETAKDVRTTLGEKLVEALIDTIMKKEGK